MGSHFTLVPSFKPYYGLDMYNAYGSLKLVLEVCDVKTAYIKPHCMNVSGVMFDLGPYFQGLMCSFILLKFCTSFVVGPKGKLLCRFSKSR